jgi:hypothetical protein
MIHRMKDIDLFAGFEELSAHAGEDRISGVRGAMRSTGPLARFAPSTNNRKEVLNAGKG